MNTLETVINPPQHIAIIMDGNGRWAKERGYPRAFGHIRGSSQIKPIVLEANRIGVQALTLYAFSTENWKRPESELRVLWKLLIKFLKKEEKALHQNNVKLCVIGEVDRLPKEVLNVLNPVLSRLQNNTGLILNFAVSYGSRLELLEAVKKYTANVLNQSEKMEELTEEKFESYLWTNHLQNQQTSPSTKFSDVDLLIRTSGEKRISNFLLWQCAYAEFFFVNKNWPDFTVEDFNQIINEFQKRNRRFGGI